MDISEAPAKVVDRYLTAFYSGDFEAAALTVAADFTFEGPFVKVAGREAYFASAQGLRRIVRGHRLLQRLQEGEDVCSIYEVKVDTPKGSASIPMCEWHSVRFGSVTSGRVFFDPAPLRALLPIP